MCRFEIKSKEDKKLVLNYLTKEYKDGNYECKSSFYAALLHARDLTGRNLDTRKLEDEEKTGSWAGASMYFILIDHIGGMFRDCEENDNIGNDFSIALKHFSNLSECQIDILYQLRNSFIHQFNLYQFPDNKKKFENRHFSVNRDPDNFIVEPSEKFDNLDDLNGNNKTKVSLRLLGDLVEGMISDILQKLENDKLIVFSKYEVSTLKNYLNVNTICYQVS